MIAPSVGQSLRRGSPGQSARWRNAGGQWKTSGTRLYAMATPGGHHSHQGVHLCPSGYSLCVNSRLHVSVSFTPALPAYSCPPSDGAQPASPWLQLWILLTWIVIFEVIHT